MKNHTNTSDHCPTKVLKLLGDYVILTTVDTLRDQEFRFRELTRALPTVNQVTLARRLKVMEAAGVVERREETIDRQSVTYRLTSMGLSLLPLLEQITLFSQKFNLKD